MKSATSGVADRILVRHMISPRLMVSLTASVSLATGALAADDAEVLSRRVPNQRYKVLSATICGLERGNALWGVPLWACDPATLTITKVLGGSAVAPYAIAITTRPNDPIEEISSGKRVSTIHLLAASLEDAIKMRRALIKEIEVMQREIEHRQGNSPGYLKSAVQHKKR